MIKAYYALHSVSTVIGPVKEYGVILLDDADPTQLGLAQSGYFQEIKDPESREGTHRAG